MRCNDDFTTTYFYNLGDSDLLLDEVLAWKTPVPFLGSIDSHAYLFDAASNKTNIEITFDGFGTGDVLLIDDPGKPDEADFHKAHILVRLQDELSTKVTLQRRVKNDKTSAWEYIKSE